MTSRTTRGRSTRRPATTRGRSTRRRSSRGGFRPVHGVITALAALAIVAYYALHSFILPNVGNRWIECTVTNQTAIGTGHGGTDYRVYTQQCDVLEDNDNWLYGKTSSASFFGKIVPGQTDWFHVVGLRFSLTSNFPNIIGMAPVTPPQK